MTAGVSTTAKSSNASEACSRDIRASQPEQRAGLLPLPGSKSHALMRCVAGSHLNDPRPLQPPVRVFCRSGHGNDIHALIVADRGQEALNELAALQWEVSWPERLAIELNDA